MKILFGGFLLLALAIAPVVRADSQDQAVQIGWQKLANGASEKVQPMGMGGHGGIEVRQMFQSGGSRAGRFDQWFRRGSIFETSGSYDPKEGFPVFVQESETGGSLPILPLEDWSREPKRYVLKGEARRDDSNAASAPFFQMEVVCGKEPMQTIQGPPINFPGMWQPFTLYFASPQAAGEDCPLAARLSIESTGPWKIAVRNVKVIEASALFLTEEANGYERLWDEPVGGEESGMSDKSFTQVSGVELNSWGYAPLHHFAYVGQVRWKEVSGVASIEATGFYPSDEGEPAICFCRTPARDAMGEPLELKGDGNWSSFLLPIEHTDILSRDDIPHAKAALWNVGQVLTGSGVLFVRNVRLVMYPDAVWEKLPPELKAAWGTGPIPLPPRVMPWVRWARQIHLRERWGSGAVGFVGGLLLGAGGVALVVRARRRRFLLQREEELRRMASIDTAGQ